MTTDLKEISSAIKDEMKDAYLKAAQAFAKTGDFDVMTAAYATLDEQLAKVTSERAEAAADVERKEREGRDKAVEDYKTTLLSAFTPVWTSQLVASLTKLATLNPALRFVSIQVDIKRSEEGEGDAKRATTKIADPRAFASMSGAGPIGDGSGKGRRGLEVVVSINGSMNTYQSVNAAAQAILGATANTNKETLVTSVNQKANHKVVSIGGKAID